MADEPLYVSVIGAGEAGPDVLADGPEDAVARALSLARR